MGSILERLDSLSPTVCREYLSLCTLYKIIHNQVFSLWITRWSSLHVSETCSAFCSFKCFQIVIYLINPTVISVEQSPFAHYVLCKPQPFLNTLFALSTCMTVHVWRTLIVCGYRVLMYNNVDEARLSVELCAYLEPSEETCANANQICSRHTWFVPRQTGHASLATGSYLLRMSACRRGSAYAAAPFRGGRRPRLTEPNAGKL